MTEKPPRRLRRRQIAGRPVIVIGGGISGLAAAARLLEHGVPVTILEAKRRLGGRIHTLRKNKVPIELGAEFIHGRSPALLDAIKKAGLRTRMIPDQHWLVSGGKIKRVDFFRVIEKVLGGIKPQSPDTSFQDFIEGRNDKKPIRQIARDYVEGFEAARADRISAHSLIRAQYAADQMRGSWQGRITTGYADLVTALKRQIQARGGEVIQSALVDRVAWSAGRVKIAYACNGKRKNVNGISAIVTLPLGIWKARTVMFTPALTEKQQVADELQFGNVMKVMLTFKERWWPKSYSGFIHLPGEALPTWWPGPRGAVLTGWAGGPRADALIGMSQARVKTLCFDILSKIFPRKKSRIESSFQGMHTHDWSKDTHIRGAYSYIPVNGLSLPRTLAAPVQNTLFFAGEATVFDGQTGTVFGALESGVRAANEILGCRTPHR